MNFNRVFLMGHMTRDPEIRHTNSQHAVCGFGLAVNRKFKGADGSAKEEVTFVDCEAWGRTAESIGKYFAKGRPIFVEGRLKFEEWEGKDGSKRSKLKVVVEQFEFVNSKGDIESDDAPGVRVNSRNHPAPAVNDEDIPF